jgi:hypothetical protein
LGAIDSLKDAGDSLKLDQEEALVLSQLLKQKDLEMDDDESSEEGSEVLLDDDEKHNNHSDFDLSSVEDNNNFINLHPQAMCVFQQKQFK